MFLLVGFFEEFLLRGYSLFTLARGIGFWPAAVVLSCGFGLIHLAEWRRAVERPAGRAFIASSFALHCAAPAVFGFAVGFHAAWDWGETFFYSVRQRYGGSRSSVEFVTSRL